MKSVIIYYSYSGNTRKVAKVLRETLEQKSEVEEIDLVSLDEPKSFLAQCHRALFRKRAQIAPVHFDLKEYDLVCVGTPVWAFAPVPAINTFFDQCSGLAKKSVVLFATYGSGTGMMRCLDYMQKILVQKGAETFKRFYIQQGKVNDNDFITSEINEMLRL